MLHSFLVPRGLLPRVFAIALAAPGIGAAAPALEYGPEAEAVFLARCAGPEADDAATAACRRAMERLQAALGYEAFLEHASGVSSAFGNATAGRLLSVAAPTPAIAIAR